METQETREVRRPRLARTSGLVMAGLLATAATAQAFEFDMVRSGPAGCAANAKAHVKLVGQGFAEKMTVSVSGVPANTGMDLFVIQVPKAKFGLSWYVGDLQADSTGKVSKTFVGRFNKETFAVAPGVQNAPTPDGSKDASSNPAFKPIHTFHVGIWFNSNADAVRAGCPQASPPTPFNGDHTAGIQFLNTQNFADAQGPLRQQP